MKDVGSDIGVKNIPDLVLKEIYCIFETKKPSKEQVNENKMTKRKIRKRKRQQEKEKFLRTIIPLKNILLVFIKLILIFINIMKKIQLFKNGCKYIFFIIDVYFNKLLLAV